MPPDLLFKELENNATTIKVKAGFSDVDFEVFIQILRLKIKAASFSEFEDKLKEAKAISPNSKDLLYFAVALALNCPIWSGDKALKQQSKVKVYNTAELVKEYHI